MSAWNVIVEKARSFGGVQVGATPGEVAPVVERSTAAYAVVAALEQLTEVSNHRDADVFSRQVLRNRFPDKGRRNVKVLDRVFSYPAVTVIPIVRGRAAARLLLARPGHTERMLLDGLLVTTASVSNVRQHYGGDRADHMSYVTLATTFLARLFPGDPRAQRACLKFLSFQSCLAHSVSGAVKPASPVWRSGRSITGIMHTGIYGDKWLYELAKKHMAIPVLRSWMVILGELAFPLALVAPKSVARAMLTASSPFHLANGRFMGLNRFVWAFADTYPAVAHSSRALSPSAEAGLDRLVAEAQW